MLPPRFHIINSSLIIVLRWPHKCSWLLHNLAILGLKNKCKTPATVGQEGLAWDIGTDQGPSYPMDHSEVKPDHPHYRHPMTSLRETALDQTDHAR